MKVKEIMSDHPAVCLPNTPLQEVAQLMLQNDCGAVPVVENLESKKLAGIVTDRDIACRAVAEGKNPLKMTAGDVMSTSCCTVSPEESIEDCVNTLETNQVRRVPVVDDDGACCGVVAQADIALHASEHETAHAVREISQPVGAV
ncbi:MAG: CBS domain-containing protein [Planctomycetaceae bacterium]